MASSRPVAAGDHVFLVDGSSFIFRAYFQSMNQDSKYNTRISDGMPTGAVRLFVTKLLQFVRDGAAGLKPTHLAIVLDKSEGSFRKELYEDYKGHRPDAPSDLKVADAADARGDPRLRPRARSSRPRYEADDLIATYTQEAKARGADVLIISSDKDLMQLVGPQVCFYDFESGAKGKPGYRPERNLDEAAVTENWEGIPPEKIGDVLALMGDTSDNVPGVPGIGLKTAAQLIKEYGDLETLLARAGEIKQPKRRETLIANADKARLSKQLVTLDCEAPLPVAARRAAPAGARSQDPRRLPQGDGVQHPHPPGARSSTTSIPPRSSRIRASCRAARRSAAEGDGAAGSPPAMPCRSSARRARPPPARSTPSPASTCRRRARPASPLRAVWAPPRRWPERARREAVVQPFDTHGLRDGHEPRAPDANGSREAREQGFVAVDTETSALDANRADLVGFSLALEAGKACLRAAPAPRRLRTSSAAASLPGQIPVDRRARRAPAAARGRARSSRSGRT